ncbi:hypothetical protein Tco_0939996 [Tanacetum coccineum]|uniref:Retrotransposon gag domain-containing protein n=1 Tax=Tanacetum coccineum TaxID=301880 RepID=A0ABQ5DLP7_9ASTR
MHSHQNESLAIAGRNLFDDEASSSNNTIAKLPTPPKTLHEHSRLNSSGFENLITFPTEQTRRIVDSRDIWLIQSTCTFQGSKNEDPLCHVKHYLSIVDNIQADGAIRDTSRLRFFYFSLRGKAAEWLDRIPLTQITTWDQLNSPSKQVCLSRGDIYNDPSFLRFYQNVDTSPWGNNKCKEKGEDGSEWIVRSKFEDELANFMLKKKSYAKRIGDMLVQHRKELREQYSQILSAINKSETPEPEAPTFAIITRSGISTQDPPFPASPRPATDNFTEGETEKEGPEGAEPSITQEPSPDHSSFTNLPRHLIYLFYPD